MSHRNEIYVNAANIIQYCLLIDGDDEGMSEVHPDDGRVLRECWECSRIGNLLLQAWADVTGEDPTPAQVMKMLRVPGFLTKRETDVANLFSGKRIQAYRGCTPDGVKGMSWTLDMEVAEFFAQRYREPGVEPVIATAAIKSPIWLNTAESEIIGLEVDAADILSVEPLDASKPEVYMEWETRRPIVPGVRRIYTAPVWPFF